MRILILITGLNTGGAERFLLKVLPHVSFDFKLVSVLGSGSLIHEFESRGIEVESLCSTHRFSLKSIFKFRRIVCEYKPDTLLTYLLHADLFGRFFGRLFGVKRVVCSIRNDNSSFKILNLMDKWTSFLVDLYLPNSYALRDFLVNKNNISSKKIKVVENAISCEEIESQVSKGSLREELGISKRAFIYMCVARLKEQKDHLTLLRAFSSIDSGYLVLVGSGDYYKRLESEVKSLGISDQVFFIGDRSDVFNLLFDCDVFVLPSLIEGMSNALMEAMALGKPCIVSNIKQNRVLIKNGVNGMTFRVSNSKDLSKKMLDIKDKKLRSKYSKESRKLIKEKYSVESIASKLESVLR